MDASSRVPVLRSAAIAILTTLSLALVACQPAPAGPTAAPPKPTAAAAKPAAQPAASPAAKPAASPVAKPAASPVAKAEDMAAIYEAAKKEGKVAVYSSMNVRDAEGVFPRFEARFPGVKVDHVRAGSEALIQRMVTEIKAGRVLADVLETNGLDWLQVIKENLIEPFNPPNAAKLPADMKSDKHLWFTTRVNQIVIQCNTTRVPREECNKLTLDSLGEPKWKDEILLEKGDVEYMLALCKRKYRNDDQCLSVFKRIAANNPGLHTGHTETSELLIAGQGSVFASAYLHRVYTLQEKGAPSDWARTEGVLQQQLVGKVKGGPNPNAAKLFADWMLSEEAAQAIAKVGRVPGRPDVKLEQDFYPQGVKWYPQQPEDADEYQRYQRLWNEVFGLR